MIIRVPIPTLGVVTIFTEKGDFHMVTCNAKPGGFDYRDIPESTLTVVQCDTFTYATIVYFADLGEEIELGEIFTRILSLQINTTSVNVKDTIFTAT